MYNVFRSAAVDMVDQIRARFQQTLDNLDWMDEGTRARAKEKADAMVEYIGYPEELRDMTKLRELYSGLTLSPDSYVGNGLNLSRYHMNFAFSKLRFVPIVLRLILIEQFAHLSFVRCSSHTNVVSI